jgi:hypothetical protein
MPLFFQSRPEPDHSPEMGKVRAMCEHLARPYWMPNPQAWIWARPDGKPQGFGVVAASNPGLANLLWLSMEMDRPPLSYDAAQNGLYSILITQGYGACVGGEPLLDVAGLLPLREFARQLEQPASGQIVEQAYPLLRLLAQRRLDHAGG